MPAKKIVTVACIHCGGPALIEGRQRLRWLEHGRPYCSTSCRDLYVTSVNKGRPPQPIEDRFWSKVDKNGPKQSHMKTQCWVWIGNKPNGLYGHIKATSLITKQAHHVPFFLESGVWPRYVMHRCDTPACVRRSHLKEGDAQKNRADTFVKGRAIILRGEDASNAKLTSFDVQAIRTLSRRGITQTKIAKQFGVKQSYISSIITGKRWAHL